MESAEIDLAAAAARIAASARMVLVIGAADAGKTTLCAEIVNAALTAGRRVAVVDADIGQSEIGPPCCVGWARVAPDHEPIRTLGELPTAGLVFVGATSPTGCLLEHASAVRLAADAAARWSPDLTVVDTTGLVLGPAARRLKEAKLALLAPSHVVAIQRGRELEPLLAPLRHSTVTTVERLPAAPAATRKTPAVRTTRRAARFARYFEAAELRWYEFEKVACSGTWLNGAPPVPPHLLTWLSTACGVRVYHAEENARHLGMVTSAPVPDAALASAQEQFRAQAITVTPVARLRHLIVGLCDAGGSTLGVGLLEAVEFRRGRIGVLTPIRAHAAVRVVRFGLLRVEPGGRELGTNRAGDV